MATALQIEELLKGDYRYEKDVLPELVAYIDTQLKEGTYDIDANLAILKLYLIYPDETDVAVIERVLVKALMAFPDTDFSLCMYQIPEKYHVNLKDIMQLAQQLEMAKFVKFWKDAEGVEALTQAKGWKEKIRSFIAGVVSATYRSIKSEQLLELLNLPKGELDAMIKAQGWQRSKEDKETVTVNTATFESVVKAEKEPTETTMSLDQYRTFFLAATSA